MVTTSSSPRQRFGGTKVRTGCTTCKLRRVKCDEAKPSCQRCLKAHRKCGGYLSLDRTNAAGYVHYAATVNCGIDDLPDLDAREKRALSVFHHVVAPKLAAQFCIDLYSRHLMLAAVHEEAVRDGVIALSTLHEESFGILHAAHSNASEFALEHYGRAMNSMVRLNTADAAFATDIALLGCLVFASLEALQGHYHSALTHFKSGLKVLGEHSSDSTQASGPYVPRILFRQTFVRIESQCLEMSLMSPKDCPLQLNRSIRCHPISFASLSQALVSLSSKFSQILLFLQDPTTATIGPDAPQERIDIVMRKRQELVGEFVWWCQTFYYMPRQKDDKIEDVAICELYKTFIGIILRLDFSQGQTAFDAFEKEQLDIVILASIFLARVSNIMPKAEPRRQNPEVSLRTTTLPPEGHGTSPTTGHFLSIQADATPVCRGPLPPLPPSRLHRPTMPILPQPGSFFKPTYVSIGLGIIHPLFSVSIRCRNTRIRLQALHLLRMSNRKEGMWDSMIGASVAQAIVALEMAAVPGLTDNSPSSAIPEHARVREVHGNFLDPRRGLLHVVRSAECKCPECRTSRKDRSPSTTEQVVDW